MWGNKFVCVGGGGGGRNIPLFPIKRVSYVNSGCCNLDSNAMKSCK